MNCEILEILFRQCRKIDRGVRQIDSLVGAELAARFGRLRDLDFQKLIGDAPDACRRFCRRRTILARRRARSRKPRAACRRCEPAQSDFRVRRVSHPRRGWDPCVSTKVSPRLSVSRCSRLGSSPTTVSTYPTERSLRRRCSSMPGVTYAVFLDSVQKPSPDFSRHLQFSRGAPRVGELDFIFQVAASPAIAPEPEGSRRRWCKASGSRFGKRPTRAGAVTKPSEFAWDGT